MSYSKTRKSISKILAMVLVLAMTLTGVITNDLQVMAAGIDEVAVEAVEAADVVADIADATEITDEASTADVASEEGEEVSEATIVSEKLNDGTPVTNTFNFTASKFFVENGDNYVIPEGTRLQDDTDADQKGYFKVVLGEAIGDAVPYVRKRGSVGQTKGLEIQKYGVASVRFTVTGTADASFDVCSTGKTNDSWFALEKEDGTYVMPESVSKYGKNTTWEGKIHENGAVCVTGNLVDSGGNTVTYKGLTAGKYKITTGNEATCANTALTLNGSKINRATWLLNAKVTETYVPANTRTPWAEVATPAVTGVTVNESSIDVTATGLVSDEQGADYMTVNMYDATNKLVQSVVAGKETNERTTNIVPTASGDYRFTVSLVRGDEEAKVSEFSSPVHFDLPMGKPSITSVTNKGDSKKMRLEVVFSEVPEADYYDIEILHVDDNTGDYDSYKCKDVPKVTLDASKLSDFETIIDLPSIAVPGEPVVASIVAKSKKPNVKDSVEVKSAETTLLQRTVATWAYDTFGTSTKLDSKDKATPTINSNGDLEKVQVSSCDNGGKIVPKSTDGLSYYYTKIEPDKNFTLAADVHVDNFTYSNGQEGFGLMVSDRIAHYDAADGAVWNNSIQLLSSAIEYRWNEKGYLSDDTNDYKFNLRLAPVLNLKQNVTPADLAALSAGTIDSPVNWTYSQTPMDTSVGKQFAQKLRDAGWDPITTINANTTANSNFNSKSYWNNTTEGSESRICYGKPSLKNMYDIPLNADYRYEIKRVDNAYIVSYYELETAGYVEVAYDDDENETQLPYAEKKTEDGKSIVRIVNPYVLVNGEKIAKYTGVNEKNQLVLAAGADKGTLVIKTDESGEPVTIGQQVIMDPYRQLLTKLKKSYVYAGFVAARNTQMTATNITVDVVDAGTAGYEAVDSVKKQVAAAAYITTDTAQTAFGKSSQIGFKANADGNLTIVNSKGKILVNNAAVNAGKTTYYNVEVEPGKNDVSWTFIRKEDYAPDENTEIFGATKITGTYAIYVADIAGDTIYVKPTAGGDKFANATANAGKVIDASTPDKATDIFTAVYYAKPGQTIKLAAGTYDMQNSIQMYKTHDGTKTKPYRIEADSTTTRPVLDFKSNKDGRDAVIVWGDYWNIKGIDICNNPSDKKGLTISGSYGIFEDLYTYENTNSGVSVAKSGDDTRAEWPAYNTIINCTSINNSDSGYEDADGFCAKITVGKGNKFVGCISAYNADDGWDLYAKSESGAIDDVTMENSVAFMNGYVIVSGNNLIKTVNGKVPTVKEAGNGNGFKMGGEGLSGYHVLRNSKSFANKADGITSNNNPSNQVFNVTSYANESTNCNLYVSKAAANTDYSVSGLLSYDGGGADSIKGQGTQYASKYCNETNFYHSLKAAGVTPTNYAGLTGNINGVKVDNTWFKNLNTSALLDEFLKAYLADDFTNINKGVIGVARNASTNNIELMNDYLELNTENATVKAALDKNIAAGSYLGADLGNYNSADNQNEIYEVQVIAGYAKTLKDIELPAVLKDNGYTWQYPDTDLTIYEGTAAEFTAVCPGKGNRTVLLSNIKINGVKIAAPYNENFVVKGELTNDIVISPATLPADVDFNKPVQGMDNCKLTYSYAAKTVEIKAENSGVDYVIKSIKAGSATTNEKIPFKLVTEITNKSTGKSAKATATVDLVFTAKSAGAAELTELDETKKIYVPVGSEVDLKLKKTDAKVAVLDGKVASFAGGKIKGLAIGTTTVTITDPADKTNIARLDVTVTSGKQFKSSVALFDIDAAKAVGMSFAALPLVDGLTVSNNTVVVDKVYKGKDSTKNEAEGYAAFFSVDPVGVGDGFVLNTKTSTTQIGNSKPIDSTAATKYYSIPKGVYTLCMKVQETGAEFEPVSVQVTESMPRAKVKWTKPVNTFYAANEDNGAGQITVKCKFGDVELTPVADNDLFYNITQEGKNLYRVDLVDYSKLKTSKETVSFKAHYLGYKPEYDNIIANQKIRTAYTAPKLAPEIGDQVVYSQLGFSASAIKIMDKKSKQYLVDATVKMDQPEVEDQFSGVKDGLPKGLIDTNTKNGIKVKVAKATTTYTTYSVEFKDSCTASLYVKADDWRNGININVPLKKDSKKLPQASIAPAILSSANGCVGLEQSVSLIKFGSSYVYEYDNISIDLKAKGDAAAKILENLDYKIDVDEVTGAYALKAKFKSTDVSKVAPGKYTFTGRMKVNGIELEKDSTFALTVQAPLIDVNVSGKINAVDRVDSTAKMTIKAVGINYNRIKEVTLDTVSGVSSDGANQFVVEWDNVKNCGYISAKDGINLNTGNYTICPVFTLESYSGDLIQVAASKPVKVNVVQNSLTFAKTTTAQLRLSHPDSETAIKLTVNKPAKAAVESLTQLDNTANFKVDSMDAYNGNIYVSIKDTRGLKPGNYSIKCEVNPVNGALNAKKQVITLKVVVLH